MRKFPFFHCLQESSWGGAEAAAMNILDKFCFRFVFGDDCMSVMSRWSLDGYVP